MNYSKDGITVAAMLDTRRTKPNEKYPVKIRVTYRRDRRYYPTGKDLTPEEWEMLGATKARALVAVRKDIESSYQIVRAAVEDLAGNGGFSLDALNDRLKGAASNTVNAMFRAKIAELEKAGRVGSMLVYDNVLKGLERLNNSNKKKIWKLSEMDADHVTAWSKGVVTDISNCQMLCKTHNRAKGNK